MRVLIIGGYGVFGGRLARLLADEPRLTLVIAGRSLDRAQAFCARLEGRAAREPAAVDRDGDLTAALTALQPDLVVDASGPFQAYGPEPYRVARAAIAAGASYVDLADGKAFVCGISALQAQAEAAGVFVLSGASTVPALSSAVVRALAEGLQWIHGVAAGISPSPHADVGPAVVAAMAAYAGKPIAVRRGQQRTVHPWTETVRYRIAPPGVLPLQRRRFSLVETPDLTLIPQQWPQLRTVWVGAGPMPELLHRSMNLMAWLVRLRLLRSLEGMAALFHGAKRRLRWGEDRGGMFVRVTGYLKESAVERSWHLVAEGDDGPYVPAMAAAALVRRMLEGRPPAAGARPCVQELTLQDFEPLFAARGIRTGRRSEGAGLPLYRRALGDAYDRLPPTLQAMHAVAGLTVADGEATVERGRNPLGRLVAAIMGLPKAGRGVPLAVAFLPGGGAEEWRRSFDGRIFRSVQSEGEGAWQGLVVERFGLIKVGLALVADEGRLRLAVRRWTVLGLPLPLWVGPGGESYEYEADGRFHFHVEIRSVLTGLIVRYKGWLEPRRASAITPA